MIDSCRPSKLEPGFAATYSNPSVLITSTMKSDAGCSTIRDRPPDGGVSVSAANWAFDGAAAAGRAGASGGCGSATDGWVTSAAAPTAAPLRKPRRSTEPFVDSAIGHSSWSIGSTPSVRREGAYTNRLRTFGAGEVPGHPLVVRHSTQSSSWSCRRMRGLYGLGLFDSLQ